MPNESQNTEKLKCFISAPQHVDNTSQKFADNHRQSARPDGTSFVEAVSLALENNASRFLLNLGSLSIATTTRLA